MVRRSNDALAVLAGRIPSVPVSARVIHHIPIAEFEIADEERRWLARDEDDEIVVLHFARGTLIRSKLGDIAISCSLREPPEESSEKSD